MAHELDAARISIPIRPSCRPSTTTTSTAEELFLLSPPGHAACGKSSRGISTSPGRTTCINSGWGGLNALTPRILTGATAVAGTGNQSGTYNLALAGGRPAFELEFRNRVREIRDLLFNTNQAWQLIDEHAWLVRGPTNGPDLPRRRPLPCGTAIPRWPTAPTAVRLGKAGQGEYYQWSQEPTVSKDFNGCIQLMKNYVVIRGDHLDSLAADAAIPAQPTATYTGPTNYPLNRLTFQCSTYSGANPFAA